jgi:membrane-bound serine protease (ClpP class)
MLPLLSTLSPNIAVLLLTLGFALIALELNRPGLILPGAAGLLLALLSIASLLRFHPSAEALLEIVASMALLLLQFRRTALWIVACSATIVLTLGLVSLLPPTAGLEVSPWIAVPCGLFLGVGITVLTRIARRARQNKGLD